MVGQYFRIYLCGAKTLITNAHIIYSSIAVIKGISCCSVSRDNEENSQKKSGYDNGEQKHKVYTFNL